MSEWIPKKSDFGRFGTRNFYNSASRSSPELIFWLFILTCYREAFWKHQKDLVYTYFTKITFSTRIRRAFDADSTRIGRGFDADWTRIRRGFDADSTRIVDCSRIVRKLEYADRTRIGRGLQKRKLFIDERRSRGVRS